MLRKFLMIRNADETGVSGTGHVLDGVVWPNGMVTIMWNRKVRSITMFPTFENFMEIHVDSHPGNLTEIVWEDDVKYGQTIGKE